MAKPSMAGTTFTPLQVTTATTASKESIITNAAVGVVASAMVVEEILLLRRGTTTTQWLLFRRLSGDGDFSVGSSGRAADRSGRFMVAAKWWCWMILGHVMFFVRMAANVWWASMSKGFWNRLIIIIN
jgi:hypothetical protein